MQIVSKNKAIMRSTMIFTLYLYFLFPFLYYFYYILCSKYELFLRDKCYFGKEYSWYCFWKLNSLQTTRTVYFFYSGLFALFLPYQFSFKQAYSSYCIAFLHIQANRRQLVIISFRRIILLCFLIFVFFS